MFFRTTVLSCQLRKIMWVMETEIDMHMFCSNIYRLSYNFVVVIFDCLIILFVFHVMMVEIESSLQDTVSFKQSQLVNNQYDVKYGLWIQSSLWLYGMIICHCPNYSYYVLCIHINTPWKKLTWFHFNLFLWKYIFFRPWRCSLISILILQ